MAPIDAIWLFSVWKKPLPTTSWLPAHPPPIRVLVVLAMPVENYLKWWEIHLVIHSIVGE